MSMKSLEDLERAFDKGLNAWESGIAEKRAAQMGQKCVREVKRNTPHIGKLKAQMAEPDAKAGRRSPGHH